MKDELNEKASTKGIAVRRYIYREYWNEEETYTSYSNMIHTPEDKKVSQWMFLRDMICEAGIEDGEEFEITINRTDNRPFPNRIWKLVRPGTYEPVERKTSKQEERIPWRRDI